MEDVPPASGLLQHRPGHGPLGWGVVRRITDISHRLYYHAADDPATRWQLFQEAADNARAALGIACRLEPTLADAAEMWDASAAAWAAGAGRRRAAPRVFSGTSAVCSAVTEGDPVAATAAGSACPSTPAPAPAPASATPTAAPPDRAPVLSPKSTADAASAVHCAPVATPCRALHDSAPAPAPAPACASGWSHDPPSHFDHSPDHILASSCSPNSSPERSADPSHHESDAVPPDPTGPSPTLHSLVRLLCHWRDRCHTHYLSARMRHAPGLALEARRRVAAEAAVAYLRMGCFGEAARSYAAAAQHVHAARCWIAEGELEGAYVGFRTAGDWWGAMLCLAQEGRVEGCVVACLRYAQAWGTASRGPVSPNVRCVHVPHRAFLGPHARGFLWQASLGDRPTDDGWSPLSLGKRVSSPTTTVGYSQTAVGYSPTAVG